MARPITADLIANVANPAAGAAPRYRLRTSRPGWNHQPVTLRKKTQFRRVLMSFLQMVMMLFMSNMHIHENKNL